MPMFSIGRCTTTWLQGKPDSSARPQVYNHSDTVVYHACVQHGRLYYHMVAREAERLWMLSSMYHSDTVGYHAYVQHGRLYYYMVAWEAEWFWPLSSM